MFAYNRVKRERNGIKFEKVSKRKFAFCRCVYYPWVSTQFCVFWLLHIFTQFTWFTARLIKFVKEIAILWIEMLVKIYISIEASISVAVRLKKWLNRLKNWKLFKILFLNWMIYVKGCSDSRICLLKRNL